MLVRLAPSHVLPALTEAHLHLIVMHCVRHNVSYISASATSLLCNILDPSLEQPAYKDALMLSLRQTVASILDLCLQQPSIVDMKQQGAAQLIKMFG